MPSKTRYLVALPLGLEAQNVVVDLRGLGQVDACGGIQKGLGDATSFARPPSTLYFSMRLAASAMASKRKETPPSLSLSLSLSLFLSVPDRKKESLLLFPG